jgi:hypothetical protein
MIVGVEVLQDFPDGLLACEASEGRDELFQLVFRSRPEEVFIERFKLFPGIP